MSFEGGSGGVGTSMGVAGRVMLFLLISFAAAGVLSQLIPNVFYAAALGFAGGAIAVSKLERRLDPVTAGMGLLAIGAFLWLDVFPSASACEAERSRWVFAQEKQAQAIEYWARCAGAVGDDWCFDRRPEQSLEEMDAEHRRLADRLARRCGGTGRQASTGSSSASRPL